MAETVVHTILPDALVRLFPQAPRRLDVEAETVGMLIDALDRQFPGMADCLRDTRPAVRQHINIFVRGERAELATELVDREPVYIFVAVSGG